MSVMTASSVRNGMPEFVPYVYRGTGEDTLTPPELRAILDADPDINGQAAWPHGTRTGFERHRAAGEQQCQACREAASAYHRARYRRRKQLASGVAAGSPGADWQLMPHGTTAAYRRHYRRGERPCGPCEQAYAIAAAERRERVMAGAT